MNILEQLEARHAFVPDPDIAEAIKEINRLRNGLRGVVTLVDVYATHEDIAEFAEAVLSFQEHEWT
jgi:hypothetical protein